MPVYKFKSHVEAEMALWNFRPDDQYFRRVADLWRFANRLGGIRSPEGIFKFTSIEEANRHREEMELERAIVKRSQKRTS